MVSGISISQREPTSVTVYWEPDKNLCIRKQYVVHYQLTNLDQCNDQTNNTERPAGTVTTPEIRLQRLQPYSTYTIHVGTEFNDTNYRYRASATFVTGQTGKISFIYLNFLNPRPPKGGCCNPL